MQNMTQMSHHVHGKIPNTDGPRLNGSIYKTTLNEVNPRAGKWGWDILVNEYRASSKTMGSSNYTTMDPEC